MAFGLSLPRKCVAGDSRKDKGWRLWRSRSSSEPTGSARAGYAAELEARVYSIGAVYRSAWYWARLPEVGSLGKDTLDLGPQLTNSVIKGRERVRVKGYQEIVVPGHCFILHANHWCI